MAELKCPHCGQAFTVDDTELSSIVQQIRDKEFEKDIEKRISELKEHMMMTHRLEMEAKENEIKLMSQNEHEKEIQKLKSQLEKATEKSAKLQAQLDSSEDKKIIAVMEAVKKVEEEKKEEEAVIDIEPKDEITFEQFGAMQFQVGEIIACEAVKKSKKLLCSQVKVGSQVKQIVSGIKAHYTPEEMVGKKVMVLVNLKPAKLAGVLSEGMLLCAEDAEGNLALMTPEKEMPAGAEIC